MDICTLSGFRSWCQAVGPKNAALGNKKGKSMGSDSPVWVVIKIEYHNFFDDSKVLISWIYIRF